MSKQSSLLVSSFNEAADFQGENRTTSGESSNGEFRVRNFRDF